jgi:hypothetical protein
VNDPDGVSEIVPFLSSDPLAASTCGQLLAACQANTASLQSQLSTSQAALAKTQSAQDALFAELASSQQSQKCFAR